DRVAHEGAAQRAIDLNPHQIDSDTARTRRSNPRGQLRGVIVVFWELFRRRRFGYDSRVGTAANQRLAARVRTMCASRSIASATSWMAYRWDGMDGDRPE